MAKIHVAMFPWFAIGHITPYIHLANELTARGHKVTLLLPNKTQLHFQQHLRHYPNLLTFHPITVPRVDGLPLGAETASDVPLPPTRPARRRHRPNTRPSPRLPLRIQTPTPFL
ncbi:UDP-glucuronosyl/UDP-glucosyltransferase [Trema orientale]|uniref:UDP-glucuronosyl/UDP-glucosyltransferase n=1 Tax=Trema orientale TaxID=63057 RepID=A0A2P5F4R0_TREOI|nr:UDP-glucuronosyl/UDP-glucosyltransferase [Trema orientale]